MKIGFLVIGSEVLNGKTSEANTRAFAEFLKLNHLEIYKTIIVRDYESDIKNALSSLMGECEVVVTSGGLGPTKDDITKQTIGSLLGRKIIYSEDAEEVAAINHKKYERPFIGKEHGYCYIPEGFTPLNNSTGFAPNLTTRHNDKFLILGPGVPREFRSMLEDHFLPIVSEAIDKNSFLETVLVRTRKVPEEKIFWEVDPSLWDKLSTVGEVSSLPVLFGVDIGIKIRATSLPDLQKKKESVLQIINSSPIKSAVWNIGYELMEEIIISIANEKNIKFGFAESCTGGLCSDRITNISGSSKSFMGSVVCYDERVKTKLLGVKAQTLKEHTAESLETAKEMAKGLAKNLKLDIAVSITGIAGPTGGTTEKPVGTVFIGTYAFGKVEAVKFKFHGDRAILKNRFSQAALHALLEELEKLA